MWSGNTSMSTCHAPTCWQLVCPRCGLGRTYFTACQWSHARRPWTKTISRRTSETHANLGLFGISAAWKLKDFSKMRQATLLTRHVPAGAGAHTPWLHLFPTQWPGRLLRLCGPRGSVLLDIPFLKIGREASACSLQDGFFSFIFDGGRTDGDGTGCWRREGPG